MQQNRKRGQTESSHTEDREQEKESVKIWCPHEECFKYLRVCNRCRLGIKCQSYQDYWFPRLGF